jgi:hypothetical protein
MSTYEGEHTIFGLLGQANRGGSFYSRWTRGTGPASEESRAGLGHVSDSWSPGDPRPFT